MAALEEQSAHGERTAMLVYAREKDRPLYAEVEEEFI
jgi:hypothetical protein